jgi:hypothetical protein
LSRFGREAGWTGAASPIDESSVISVILTPVVIC